MSQVIYSILLVLVGIFFGIIVFIIINYIRGIRINKKADLMLEKARKDADKVKRDYLLEAKEEAHKVKIDTEKEIKEKKAELKDSEERLLVREGNMDRRDQTLQNREQMLEEKENNIINKQREIQKEQDKVEEIKNEQITLLEKISGYSKEEARKLVLKKVEDMMSLEIASYIKDKESEAKLEADKRAKNLLVESMQKYASDVANEQTVTVVNLPNDDMKGRIIGREGRNIRTIESITGVDLIIDDTPEALVVSSFDPLRREIARLTIENLIKDGRIHPARIEEIYDKTTKELHNKIIELGNNALFELGITKVEPELVELLGKLNFRTSYGQNVLRHSIEVANLVGIMAAEIGENVALAKRAGIFHDIGKAIDHEVEGSHVDLGSEIASRYGENSTVINAIESHHGNKEATSVISSLVAIADALSASRPGARNDSLENYVKRLQDLEAIATSVDGVQSTFAIQAGRELRVIVKPDQIDDLGSVQIARNIKDKIENELQYPGTIKVVVIRETRVMEEAK
ncbi:MAG TPA: ribonuclease Y [Bacilli bacterium]|nr:ribonuclease Y [Bacilli bacterium]